jgi:DNA-binding MarR family transcriptional regulator
MTMDLEARAHSEHPEALRLWLRLLTCTQLVEKQVRSRLARAVRHHAAALRPDGPAGARARGLKMNELSRRMMVTGGNVTGITDQLVPKGLVERIDVEGDRRAYRVRLTPGARGCSKTWHAPTSSGSSSLCWLDGREVTHCTSCWARSSTANPFSRRPHEALHRGQPTPCAPSSAPRPATRRHFTWSFDAAWARSR